MPLRRCRAADGRAHQACDPGASRQRRACDFLRGACACRVRLSVEGTRGGAPTIGGSVRQATGLQQRVARDAALGFATPEDGRHHLSPLMVHGMPEPTRGGMLPTHDHMASRSASPARSMAPGTSAGFRVRSSAVCTDSNDVSCFVSSRSTMSGLSRRARAVSRIPLALRRRAMPSFFPSGRQPR